MPVRNLVILPDAQLRQISEPVVSADAALRRLVDDMFATMYDAPGIGLAAIQIGMPRRVVTIDVARKDDKPQPLVLMQSKLELRVSRLRSRTKRHKHNWRWHWKMPRVRQRHKLLQPNNRFFKCHWQRVLLTTNCVLHLVAWFDQRET